MSTTRKDFYLTAAGLLLYLSSLGQANELHQIDSNLTCAYKKAISADYNSRNDSLTAQFKKQLILQLADLATFTNHLDSLSKYLVIKSSADKKIKFYSWDDLSGGSWHNMVVISQFMSDKGNIVVQQLNSENEAETGKFTDSKIYEIHEIIIDKKKCYLTFGWGTHGSGNQHNIIQIFKITGGKIEKCNSCFANDGDYVIEYPRADKLNLAFNSKLNEITYNQVPFYENGVHYGSPTKQIISLKFNNGKIKK